MKLVIAEKPMLARDIARAVCDKKVSETARLPISGNSYTVCACAGHLLKLQEPEEMNPAWQWNKDFDEDSLPIYIENWSKVPIPGKENLINQIKDLLSSCTSVIHAGDPDDEGQLIVDEVLEYLGYQGKVERVLVNDNIEKNIRLAFERMEDNKNYAPMGKAAYARQMADFCFGLNESRLAGIRLKQRVSVGRVQTPTLGLVVRRDEEISGHKVRKFYELIASVEIDEISPLPFKFEPTEALLAGEKKIYDAALLKPIAAGVEGTRNAITAKVTEKRSHPPLPYNLTILQSDMNKQFGFTAKQTLEATQSLRDNYKAISYNRSDCQYLPQEHHHQAKEVMTCAMKNLGQSWELDYRLESKAFNDTYVSAHHGIIPQQSAFDVTALSAAEQKIYTAIVSRYAMQFLLPVILDVCEAAFETMHGIFRYKTEQTKDLGYQKVFPAKSGGSEKNSPWLKAGEYDGIVRETNITEKETSPPKPYTEGTLLTDMASIAKYVKDEEIRGILKRKDDGKKGEHGGIGTTATRSAILEKLKEKGFIETVKKKILVTEKGRAFYHLLPDEIRQADTTARWWLLQEEVAGGRADPNAIQKSVIAVFCAHKDTAYLGKSLSGVARKTVGKCPLCGKDVLDGKKVLSCASNQFAKNEDGTFTQTAGCGFRMFKMAFGKKLPETAIKQLLMTGKTKAKVKGLKSKKTGKTFEAYLMLDQTTGKLVPKF